MNEEGDRIGSVTPGRNAVDEALGLTEDPRPEPDAPSPAAADFENSNEEAGKRRAA